MALDVKLQQKLQLKLHITPQLQQAIKILQIPRGELDALIHQEMAENPVLGVEAGADETTLSEEPQPSLDATSTSESPAEDIDWHTYLESYHEDLPPLPAGGETDTDDERPNLVENQPNRTESLEQHLLDQLRMVNLTPEEQRIASLIIGNLDPDGYLHTPLEDLAASAATSVELVNQGLQLIQACDPPGVGARDLRECLLLQFRIQERERGMDDDPICALAVTLVQDHLAALEGRRFERLAKDLDVTPEEIAHAVKLIAALEPKPGRNFGGGDVSYVTPDVYIHKVGDEYVVTLNEEGLPRLKVNTSYRRLLTQGGEAKEYIQEKMRAAAWLIKSIHQRQRTLLLVAQSIVKFQEDFLNYGVSQMRPLVLRDVAEDIGIHESTVSRAIANKYIATPRGIKALKKFFTTGLRGHQGQDVAAESVKERIRQMIQAEDATRPLSDEEIARLLSRDNVPIARRTVAKYREGLNILPSAKRKHAY